MSLKMDEVGKNASHVADYIIIKSEERLTPLHINKLVFFSHGWMLGIHDRPLINETVEAWRYGPVIPSIYHAFKRYDGDRVDPMKYFPIKWDDWRNITLDIFNATEKNIIDQVIDIYSKLSGSKLIGITHKKGSPWKQCYDKNESFVEIPNEVIQMYYKGEYNAHRTE